MKVKDEKEWMLQAEYDLEVAEYLLKGGKNIYTIFMCHLSVEKALKAVYVARLKKEPPKTHNLSQLIAVLSLKAPEELVGFLADFTSMSVPARYPDELKSVFGRFDKKRTKEILSKCKKVVAWLSKELEKER